MSGHGPLAGYRALDLTDHRGALAGRWLADLGVDVVTVEPPGGDPERDLTWLAGSFGKRSVTLDLESGEGRALARRLAEASDFVLESLLRGYSRDTACGWETLAANPALVLTSITAFGQTGPRAGWKATDLTLMALGGSAFVCGDRRRAPVRIGGAPGLGPRRGRGRRRDARRPSLARAHRPGAVGGRLGPGPDRPDADERDRLPAAARRAVPAPGRSERAVGGFRRRSLSRQGRPRGVRPLGGAVGGASIRAFVAWMVERGEAPAWLQDKAWENWDYAGLIGLGREAMQASSTR